MTKSIQVGILAGLLLSMFAHRANAQSGPILKPFSLEYNFEDERSLELKPLVANGKFKVDFMGITNEKSYAGSKSFKFEITSEGGTYFTWLIPFKVSTEGTLHLSFRYQVSTTGKGKFGPGISLCYPAIASKNGADFLSWTNTTNGGWTWMDIDVTAFAKSRINSEGGAAAPAWEIRPDQVIAYTDGMVICINALVPGERLTLYIDDLTVEGQTQELSEEFDRRAIDLWQPIKEKHSATIKKMREAIKCDYALLAAHRPAASSASTLFQQTARAELKTWSAITDSAVKRGYLKAREVAAASEYDSKINSLLSNAAMLDTNDDSLNGSTKNATDISR